MTLFLSEEEYDRCSHDVSLVAEKADAFIRELYNQLETVRAQADAASITAEQTCSLLEQKYVSLSAEFSKLESQNAQLNSDLERRQSELAQVQSEKHQIHLISIEKDGNVERLSTEVSELHKSKRQLLEILGQKESEINEKNATIQSYLDKIVNVSDSSAAREARLNEIEAELARANASCSRLSEEKELILRHNTWLNDELTAKVNSLIELRKVKSELEADMSAKIEGLEKNLNESLSSLKWNKERVGELESKLTLLQEDLASAKDSAAANEQRHSDEIFTVTKLVELYKETSEEWSKKAGELEGVIKALETHLSQMEHDYKEKLEKEVSTRKEFEKEAAHLKEKLEKCEAEMESSRKARELNLLPLSSFTTEARHDLFHAEDTAEESNMVVPHIPTGVSGTALAASLIRDGWSLAKMYAKYQEAVDALRHERLGRKQSQAILERVLYKIEEKAGMILDERAEHERLVEAYSGLNQKLQHSLSEQSTLETNIQELKADLKRHEREYSIAQREITDLEKQVGVPNNISNEANHIRIQKAKEFMHLTQGNDSMYDYHQKFMELMRYAEETVPTDEKKVEKFVDGMQFCIRSALGVTEFATHHEAYGAGQKMQRIFDENAEENRKRRNEAPPVPYHQNRGNGGGNNNKRNRQNPPNQSRNQNQGGQAPVRHYYCKVCGNDHPGVNCQGQRVKCRKCGRQGHRGYECRVRQQGNNQQGGNNNNWRNNNRGGQNQGNNWQGNNNNRIQGNPAVPAITGGNPPALAARATTGAITVMNQTEAQQANVVTGTFFVHSTPAFVLWVKDTFHPSTF